MARVTVTPDGTQETASHKERGRTPEGLAKPSGGSPQSVAAAASGKWGVPEISRIYAREQLLAELDHLNAFPCTWVAAPAGYGKTCLARAYADRAAVASHWYTLERSDSDVATFFADFGAGLKALVPDAELLQYSSDIQDPIAFGRAYFKRAFAPLEGAHLLVLDDYQEVAPDAPLHGVIATAIAVLPRGTRLLILSREAPPAALARAQTYDLVARLGAEELRLTLSEAVAMARLRSPRQGLSEASVETLLERTDGWAAGFVLMLPHPVHTLPSADTAEVLFEYFVREVLGGAGEETREFLLRTAWLPSMSAEMARRMSGHPQADALLRSLLQGNYFLSRTAAPEPLYRYHQLFRLFLLQYASATWPEEALTESRRRAAAILEEAGQLDAAVRLWGEAGDWDDLTGLIGRAAPVLLGQARTQSLEGWLGGIPAAVMAERPWLLYWSGCAGVHRDPFGARSLFERAYLKFKEAEEGEGVYLAWAAICETYWLAMDEPVPLRRWLRELDIIRTRLPSPPWPEVATRVAFGAFYGLIANDPLNPQLHRWESRLLEALQSEQCPDLRLMIADLLMFHYVWNVGERGRAALVLGVLRTLTNNEATAPLSVVIARTWGEYSYEYCFGGSLDEGHKVLDEARAMAHRRGVHLYDFMLLATSAHAHLTAGRMTEARPYLDKLLRILDWGRAYDRGFFYYLRAWEAWLDGRLVEAREAVENILQYAKQFGALHPVGLSRLAAAQIELSLGNRAQALRHLADTRHWLRRVRNRLIGFGRALTLAQLALTSGRPAPCQRALRLAFAMGRQEGFIHIPFFNAETLAHLCAQALEAGIEVEYARHLIRQRDLKPPPGAALTDRWPWPVKVTTLGGLALRVNDEPVQWPRKAQHKPVDLLRALIAHGGRGVPGHKLVDELWSEAEGDAAAWALKTTLHRLRKILGREDAVQMRDGQLSLDAGCVWVDRWPLEQVLDEVRTAAARPPDAQRLGALEQTSERLCHLYQGRFLEKSELPCVIGPREALHRRYLLAVERLGAAFETMGMLDRAQSVYEHALEVDPGSEWLYDSLGRVSKERQRTLSQ